MVAVTAMMTNCYHHLQYPVGKCFPYICNCGNSLNYYRNRSSQSRAYCHCSVIDREYYFHHRMSLVLEFDKASCIRIRHAFWVFLVGLAIAMVTNSWCLDNVKAKPPISMEVVCGAIPGLLIP